MPVTFFFEGISTTSTTAPTAETTEYTDPLTTPEAIELAAYHAPYRIRRYVIAYSSLREP